ncbi:MAG: helix-turn-helix transcriptional regulator [Chitinophagaceae bacterium]|nr:helix-turn-helix transcriptional regulator [Chitinophagaceae bacterium]
MAETVHQGRAVKRLREILQVKQETIAEALGISQQSVSLLEQRNAIDPETLESIAKTLKVSVDAIKNFNEDATISIISNTFRDESAAYVQNYKCHFNPIEKWVEATEENKRLYEALLKEKDEKISLLERLLNKKR